MSESDAELADFDEVLDQLMRASRVISGVIAESVAGVESEVTLPQLRTLVLVATRPGIGAGGVAEALDVHASNATRLIDRLVQAGYLHRSDSAADRRRLELALTAAGSDLIEEVMEHRRRCYERTLRRMTAADRRRLASALEVFSVCADEPAEVGFP